MTKPGTEAKKAKSEEQAPLPNGSLPPKPTSCTSKSISTQKTHVPHSKFYTMNASHPHYLWQESAKATSHLRRIHRRSALQGDAKAQGYALCLSPEAHRAKKEHLRQCLARVTRLPRRGCSHRAITCPWKSMRTNREPPFPRLRASTQKTASRTAKKANAQGG